MPDSRPATQQRAAASPDFILPANEPPTAPPLPSEPSAAAPSKPSGGWHLTLLLLAAIALTVAFIDDAAAVAYFSKDKSDAAGSVASAVSTYGDWPPLAGLLVVIFGISVAGKNRRVGRIVLVIFVATVLAGASASALRLLTGRTRPSAAGKVAPGWHGPHLGSFKYCSFPSAHTSVIAGGAAALMVLVPWGAIPGVALVGLMAWARMRTGAHHLSDVVAGAILGSLLGAWVVRRVPLAWPPERWFARKGR